MSLIMYRRFGLILGSDPGNGTGFPCVDLPPISVTLIHRIMHQGATLSC